MVIEITRKVYLVISPFFPSQNSFRGSFIFDQVKAIENLSDFEVIVLKPKLFYSNQPDYEFQGIKVLHFDVFDLPSNFLPGLLNGLSIKSLFRKLKRENIELNDIAYVHAHSIGMGFFAKAIKSKSLQVKTILQYHGLDVLGLNKGFFKKNKWHQNWIKKQGGNICNQIDLHVGVSLAALASFDKFKEIKLQKKYVLYNGADLNKFHPIEGLKNKDSFTIGCIGNFIPIKDQLTLIKAVEELIKTHGEKMHLKFIGNGPTLTSCMDYVRSKGLDPFVSFTSELPHDKLIHFYNTCHLFVLPSYYEALGCVYLESFACNVPFIGVKGQGISEYIYQEDEDKWLIEPGDHLTLAERIKAFREKQHPQRLRHPIDINILIGNFLTYLQKFEYY